MRIETRARGMWPGLLAEVQALVPAEFTGAEPGFTSLGYREALACARGKMNRESGLAKLISGTFAYAKRQRTWLRNQFDAETLEAGDSKSTLLKTAVNLWEQALEKTAA